VSVANKNTTGAKVIDIDNQRKKKEPTIAEIKKALAESTRKATTHEKAVRAAVGKYERFGIHPLRLEPGTKKIFTEKWDTGEVFFEAEQFNGFDNVGVLLGKASKNIIDFDIDDVELIEMAAYFLPPTPAKFGRYYGTNELKLSHWLYRVSDEEAAEFSKIDLKLPKKRLSVNGKNTQYEIRGNNHQTMFPPSYILDAERRLDLICWDGGGKAEPPNFSDIPLVTVEQIDRAARLMSATKQAISEFTKGSYHDDVLAWCGLLVKAGYSKEDIERSVIWIADKTGQTGLKDRLNGLDTTIERHEMGETVNGITALSDSGWDNDLLKWFRQTVFKVKKELESDGRPTVRVVAARETELYSATLKAMIESGKFYLYNREIAIIDQDDSSEYIDSETGEIRSAVRKSARIQTLTTTAAMVGRLTREIQFVQSVADKNSGQFVDQLIKCPKSVATELADSGNHYGGLIKISGVSNIPTITASGRIVDEEWGCDTELGLFFSCKFSVTKMYTEKALEVFKEMFCDFPFVYGSVSPSEEGSGGKEVYGRYFASALSAVLAAVARPAMDICPAYVITSSQWQDGKSVMSNAIAAAIGMIGEGGSPNSPLTRGGSDEEQEKQISSVLARGKRVVVYDNHDGEFRSTALTETLTSPTPEFRVLGKSEVKTVSNRSMFIINGVNIVLSGEMQSRSILIRLARTNLDIERTFKHFDLIGWAGSNSEKIVSAAISLIEWALKQEDGDWRPTHRFKVWDKLIRRTVMLACGVDIAPPVSADKEQMMDPMEETKHEFLEWLVNRWESGLRDPKYKHYIRSTSLAAEIALDSPQEHWVNMLSKRKFDSIDVRVGRALALVKDFPFKTKNGVFRVMSKVANQRNVYWVEKL
jgi:hypothetical protein